MPIAWLAAKAQVERGELLPIIRETLSEHGKINALVERSKGTYIEELRIGIIPTVANYMLPDLFGKWQDKMGNIQLIIEEMKTEEILHAFDLKKLDVGILAGPITDSRIRVVPMYREEIRAYYPAGKKKTILIDDLQDAHPWLLTSGNCLRTQMMNFCELKDRSHRSWDYEGGSIDLLERMVQCHGGYTLVPEHYIKNNSDNYKSIKSKSGEVPAREIIAICSNKTIKWDSIEQMIRSIQHHYNDGKVDKKNYEVLNWK